MGRDSIDYVECAWNGRRAIEYAIFSPVRNLRLKERMWKMAREIEGGKEMFGSHFAHLIADAKSQSQNGKSKYEEASWSARTKAFEWGRASVYATRQKWVVMKCPPAKKDQ